MIRIFAVFIAVILAGAFYVIGSSILSEYKKKKVTLKKVIVTFALMILVSFGVLLGVVVAISKG